jgi:hypothetical protein
MALNRYSFSPSFNDEISGYVGFDDCTKEKNGLPDEININFC